MSDPRWVRTTDRRPQDGWRGQVITPGGDQRELVYAGNLWWLPDRSMYVYFTPERWEDKP